LKRLLSDADRERYVNVVRLFKIYLGTLYTWNEYPVSHSHETWKRRHEVCSYVWQFRK
jgi:hypothetical protein